MRTAEQEAESLTKKLESQRILFSIFLMTFVSITGSLIMEMLANPNLFALLLLVASLTILIGLKRLLKMLRVLNLKRKQMLAKANQLRRILQEGGIEAS